MRARAIYDGTHCLLSAVAVFAMVSTVAVEPARAAEECRYASPAEVSEAFDGEITVEVQSAASDGCVFAISERSFSNLQITNFETHRESGVVEKQRQQIESGAIEGEVIEDLGAEAARTSNTLWVRLEDGAVVTVSISIHFEQLRPMLDEDVKKAGLLAVGRLAVERVSQ